MFVGRGTKDEAYYCYQGQDYNTMDFSWVLTDRNTRLVHNHDSALPPPNCMVVENQNITQDDPSPFHYFIIARTERYGRIPGFWDGRVAYFAYFGKERTTEDFDWLVIENTGNGVAQSNVS